MSSLVPLNQVFGKIRSGTSAFVTRLGESSDGANGEMEPVEESFSSFATEWKKEQDKVTEGDTTKRFAVVGGGWGGWGAAKALCEAEGVEVTLLDALPDPTGKTPYLSKTGKPGACSRSLQV